MNTSKLALLMSTLLIAACGGSGGDQSETTVKVAVKNMADAPVSGAVVGLGTATETTGADGIATFTVDGDYSGKANISKSEFTEQQVVVTAIGDGNSASFDAIIKRMVLVGNNTDFSNAATTPVVISQGDGAAVTIDDNNAFVDEAGNPYTDLVDVFITPIDVTDDNDRAAFPGEYSGFAVGSTTAADIMSYGMADYTFTDQAGNELQLSSGTTASVDIPIFQEGAIGGENALVAGDEVPMWYYDFDAGTWKENALEKGTVTAVTVGGVSKLVLRGNVSHFTPWNCDDFPQTGNLITKFSCGVNHNDSDTATAFISSAGSQGTYTIRNGQSNGKAGVGEACVSITNSSCSPQQNYDTQCVNISAGQTSTIEFTPVEK